MQVKLVATQYPFYLDLKREDTAAPGSCDTRHRVLRLLFEQKELSGDSEDKNCLSEEEASGQDRFSKARCRVAQGAIVVVDGVLISVRIWRETCTPKYGYGWYDPM